ncbi:terminase small subunit [Halomonas sp. I1]|uniref:terminase small subunit n=1 Tax=Halomonas sp. I1 TaxID=393536 RepID=UPI0028DF0923|nr:terminase small subunit [Halomonas sp. I1]MDT8894196.1 terminase small subunit [Halomonas sp. I1]
MTKKAAKGAVELTPRQSRFVDEYLVDLNATQAAIRAGYSERTARQTGAQNLSKPNITDAIEQRKAHRSERTRIDADYVLHRLVEIDQMDVADILADDGSILPVREWPQSWRRTLSGLDVAELWDGQGEEREQIGLLKKIKWPDKVKNLEMLGKHVDVQAWRERHDHSSEDGSMTPKPTTIQLVAPNDDSDA